jgi:hypothetical protein
MSDERDDLDLGDGHRIVFAEYKGDRRVGGNVIHPPVEGKCNGDGWISFEGRAWASELAGIPSWKVESEEPLTLSPSILCRACGDHGFIREGKWVKA